MERQKILAIAVLALAGGYILYEFAWGPWTTAMEDANKERQKAKSELAAAKEKVRRETQVAAEWKALREKLLAVKGDEASNQLLTLANKLSGKHDLKKTQLSPEATAPLAGSPGLREHPVALSFQCSWDSFVKLLLDLYAADELVRIQRLGVQSHYLDAKESYLDVSQRLSTVSAAPERPAR
jgi:hypothetical protein